ncbi:MAG: MotA/TolQ/ExbB proton channel family protein [Deltaproteobacteria bacterium]|nr:MotA/TolQ/ExbB proton channel family protein [Deltaproteobacteria bacterium]
MVESFMSMVQVGVDWVLYLLIVTSVVSIVLFVERAWRYHKASGNLDELRNKILGALRAGEKKRSSLAEELAQSDMVPARIGAVALNEMTRTPEAAQEVVESRMLEEKRALERGLNFLGTVGSNAPFVGLFGTVLGIVKAFADLGHTKAAGPQVVMAGISEALVATAVGLLVAIPAVVAYNAFKGKVKTILTDSQILVHLVSSYHLDEFIAAHGLTRPEEEMPSGEDDSDGKEKLEPALEAVRGGAKGSTVQVRPTA